METRQRTLPDILLIRMHVRVRVHVRVCVW